MNISLFKGVNKTRSFKYPFPIEPEPEPKNGFALFEVILFCMVAFLSGYYIGWIHTHGVIEGSPTHQQIEKLAGNLIPAVIILSWIVIGYLWRMKR